MTSVNISTFRKNLYGYVKNAIDFNDVVEVNTKNGRVIVISEEDYTGLIETLYLNGSKKTIDDIEEAKNTPQNERISLDEVDW